MSNSKRTLAVVLLVFVCLTLSLRVNAQTETAGLVKVENLYLAKDDGTGKPGQPAEMFLPGDVPIHCVVSIEPAVSVNVTMRITALDVVGLKPESKMLSANYTVQEGQNIVYFNGRPYGSWLPGKYRVDILIAGRLSKSIEFEVRRTGVEKPSNFAPNKPRPRPRTRKNWTMIPLTF